MAEKTAVPKAYTIPVPEGIDAVTAAAMPASALTSLFPLKWGAKLQPGETVLINGATGISGKLAVQIAKLLGAGRVIGTGRNPQSMKKVLELGADAVIDLTQSDEKLAFAFKAEAGKLQMNIEQVPLEDIESVWNRADFQGKRIVVVP